MDSSRSDELQLGLTSSLFVLNPPPRALSRLLNVSSIAMYACVIYTYRGLDFSSRACLDVLFGTVRCMHV